MIPAGNDGVILLGLVTDVILSQTVTKLQEPNNYNITTNTNQVLESICGTTETDGSSSHCQECIDLFFPSGCSKTMNRINYEFVRSEVCGGLCTCKIEVSMSLKATSDTVINATELANNIDFVSESAKIAASVKIIPMLNQAGQTNLSNSLTVMFQDIKASKNDVRDDVVTATNTMQVVYIDGVGIKMENINLYSVVKVVFDILLDRFEGNLHTYDFDKMMYDARIASGQRPQNGSVPPPKPTENGDEPEAAPDDANNDTPQQTASDDKGGGTFFDLLMTNFQVPISILIYEIITIIFVLILIFNFTKYFRILLPFPFSHILLTLIYAALCCLVLYLIPYDGRRNIW